MIAEKKNQLDLAKGSFINYVMQVGEGGSLFCDTMYEGLSKTVISVWQWGRGQKISKFDDVVNGWPPKSGLWNVFKFDSII